jgi:hypothetical protein
VGGDICTACCGSQREVTIDCPRDCSYLREARLHEAKPELDPALIPNQDIRLTEEFMRAQDHVLLWLTNALVRAMEGGKAVDTDAREALEALIRTYRTLESGLIYESRPQNPYAAGVQEALKKSITELRQAVTERTGMNTLRDSDVLGVLVFLQRLEYQHNNGRRRGRAFFDFLSEMFPPVPAVSARV